jgi:PAS domain S-box-containing protein
MMMQDGDTDRLQTLAPTTLEQVRSLHQHANQMQESLRAQRETLRQQGMNLPANALDTAKLVKTSMDKLSSNVTSLMTELKQLRELANTAAIISSSLDRDEVLNQVMDTVVRITGAERGYIALRNRDTGTMEYPVRRGIDREVNEQGDLVVSSSVVNEVMASGVGVLTENASKDFRFQANQSVIGFQLRSILAVPLKVQDEVIGVVYCDNRIVDGLFKPSDLNLLSAFANQAGVAIENARLYEALRQQVAEMTQVRDLLANIFASLPSGVITLNETDVVTDCNPAAAAVFAQDQQVILGQMFTGLLQHVPAELSQALRDVRQQNMSQRLECTAHVGTLEERIWNISISPLRGEGDRTQGVVMVIDDLTDARKMEKQLGIASNYLKLKLENIRDAAALDTGGQEREISVLHSDVRGFTSFSEQLAPERLMEIINRYISLSSDAINLYDGVVDKYMGDAVTGLFNTQFNPQSDHALRAVRAAMSMRFDLLALHEVLPEDQRLYYGIGVHSGMAVLGNIGGTDRKEFGALGDAPDLAKLLQENAEKGEVLISAATYELVKEFYECEALPPRKQKDRTDLTVMYRVLRHKKRTGALDPVLVGL